MDTIMDIAERYALYVVEDAAQAIDSYYKGRPLGGIGHLGCFSFHETKNIQCGEGGMLVVNDPQFTRRAEIIWEKGTDRAAFFRGEVDKYGWVDVGSSFLPSEVTAAFLWAQLENLHAIQARRKAIWKDYFGFFSGSSDDPEVLKSEYLQKFKKVIEETQLHGKFKVCGEDSSPNAHLFFLVFDELEDRSLFIERMKAQGLLCVFHYQSLHQSGFIDQYQGLDEHKLPNSDRFTETLVRLPLFFELV